MKHCRRASRAVGKDDACGVAAARLHAACGGEGIRIRVVEVGRVGGVVGDREIPDHALDVALDRLGRIPAAAPAGGDVAQLAQLVVEVVARAARGLAGVVAVADDGVGGRASSARELTWFASRTDPRVQL